MAKCPDVCPMCGISCTFKNTNHVDESGMLTAHQCGKHWWWRYKLRNRFKFIIGLTDFSPESRKEIRDWRREQNG